jgi:hypothetical protein
VAGRVRATGVVAPGEVFDARDFLESLSPAHLSSSLPPPLAFGELRLGKPPEFLTGEGCRAVAAKAAKAGRSKL